MFLVRIVLRTVSGLLGLVQLMMLVRAVMSWVVPGEQSRLTYILEAVTEPFIMPMRRLLSRVRALDRFPIDLSMLATFVALSVIQRILYIF